MKEGDTMRLIDADELKEAMEEHTDYKGYLVCAPEEIIDLAPTISGWIEITIRPVTDEEREDFDDDVTYIFTCKLPDDGETVLITTCSGDVCTDYFIRDGNICYFEDHQDVDEIIAWMPLPTPYMKEGDQK